MYSEDVECLRKTLDGINENLNNFAAIGINKG
jgi:hypothetical protein